MKKGVFWLFGFLALPVAAWSQATGDHKLPFQDSVRVVMETGQNTETSMVGGTFATAWHKLSLTQQEKIMIQANIMRKRRYKPFPMMADYYGAIAFAVEREGADSEKLDAYLRVAGKVIDKEKPAGIVSFFHYMRDYFEYHAFHYERSFRMHAEPESYTFDYIDDAPELPQADSVQATDAFQQLDANAPPDNNTVWQDDTTKAEAAPSWMPFPAPQPVLAGPVMKLEGVTFVFSTPYDSASLRNTRGTVSLRDGTFVGEKGTFGWDPAGLSGDSVFFEFKEYNFNVDKPNVKAENGRLRYAGKVARKVDGIFEFKSIRHKDKAAALYPRFMSFQANVVIEGLGDENMHYTGGLALNGKRMFSSSVSGEYARLEVFYNEEKKFVARSRQFEFKDSIITAKRAMIQLYQDNDSIFHPAIQLRYDYGKKHLSLDKEMGQLRDTPYTSTFFGVDFSTDMLRWDIKSDSINLVTIGGNNQAAMIIESKDYYHPDDYRLLSGKGFRFHPLAAVISHANRNGVREFYLDDMAQAMNLDYAEGRMAMTFLSQKGMINYNAQTGWVVVKDKAFHFVESRKGIADYDNMKIHSISENTANASINLKRRRMVVRGVEDVNVSDSLNVLLKPDSSMVTLLQNRDIKFDGKITAGNFEINGKDFTFKYDSFFINLNKIDSIRFYVTEKNAKGQLVRRRVNNAMVAADSAVMSQGGMASGAGHTSGTLFINLPDNKAGRRQVPNFPRLDATAGGVIYFDRSEILDGAYDRSVFFVIPPFKLDSLNDADPASIHFNGTFVSSGMFPTFKEQLHTMSDKSLGFSHTVPPQGYQLFHSEGKVYGNINLDNSGIRVGGRIDYLAASVESNDFIFYPDSVLARGVKGELKEKQFGNVWFPQATLTDYTLKWRPRADRFELRNQKGPFNLYKGTAQLNGLLTVSKTGTTGAGKLITRGSEAKSDEMTFSAKELSARRALFQVKTTNPDKPALQGNDIRLRFNLEKNFAEISPEIEGVAAIEFPYAQYKTSIPTARWDLTSQKITMTKDVNIPLENSYFYTTRKDLDSLAFNAEKAEYDIKLQQMKVSGIPFITVADAKITPENNEVLILENAKIGQLKNTTIVLDTLNGYHRMINGVVDIISRKEFTGYATYEYINSLSDTFKIKMENFRLEPIPEEPGAKKTKHTVPRNQTVANGTIPDQMKMVLAPRMFYKGDMVMYASKPALQLNGYARLDLKKIKNYDTWLHYSQSGDEPDIFIDFDHAQKEDGGRPDAGLHFGADNNLYITFVTDKKVPDDDDFFLPSGSLFFDKESGEFKIEDRQKSAGEKLSGKVFSYNEDKQEVKFEGPVNFFRDSREFGIVASAIGSGNLETNEIRANALVMAKMNVPAQIFQMMAADLQNIIKNEDVPEGLGDQTELLYKIADIVGERTAKDFEQKSLQGPVSLSTIPNLNYPMVFSNVNLKWSQKHKAFYSEGNIGLSHLMRSDVNGAFEGFMEIRRNEDGTPVFHVFIKARPESWYYFGYEDNRLMIQSSRQSVNDLVSKKTNASKAKLGDLVFIPGSDEETLEFINRFRKSYYGMESPYDLSAASAKKKDKKKDEKSDDGF